MGTLSNVQEVIQSSACNKITNCSVLYRFGFLFFSCELRYVLTVPVLIAIIAFGNDTLMSRQC